MPESTHTQIKVTNGIDKGTGTDDAGDDAEEWTGFGDEEDAQSHDVKQTQASMEKAKKKKKEKEKQKKAKKTKDGNKADGQKAVSSNSFAAIAEDAEDDGMLFVLVDFC